MAIWNDPRPSQTGLRAAPGAGGFIGGSAARMDVGLRKYMLSIYNYMASGVLLTGLVAMLFASSGMAAVVFASPLRLLVMLAPLPFVLAMSFGMNRMRTSTLQMLFWAYCVAVGVSLSFIFLAYTGASISATFFATAGAFAGLSLVGYTTKRDLSGMGSFMIMGLFGIMIAMLINMFLRLPGLDLAISVLGVLIFAGLTAYDTQKLRTMYYQVAGSDQIGKVVIMGALSLYLDFLNMFMFLLRFMGNRR